VKNTLRIKALHRLPAPAPEFIGRQVQRVLDGQAAIDGRLERIEAELTVLTARVAGLEIISTSIRKDFNAMDRRLRQLEQQAS
jgi:hypothetical protein